MKEKFPKIYHDIFDLERLLFQFIPKVPKDQGILKKLILERVNDLRESVYLMIIDSKNRKDYGMKADLYIESLKINCRLLADLGHLKVQQVSDISIKLVEIGKQLGGWLKNSKYDQ